MRSHGRVAAHTCALAHGARDEGLHDRPAPPRGIGQPWLWPNTCSNRPNAPLPAVDGGRPECCADPDSQAVARRSPSKTSSPSASTEPSMRRAQSDPVATQVRGQTSDPRTGGSGERIVLTSVDACGSSCAIAALQHAPARPSDARSLRRRGAARWPTVLERVGHDRRRVDPRRPSRSSSSSRIAGEATVIGTNAAWSSWTKPGSVRSEDEVAPPGRGPCSSTSVSRPAAARCTALPSRCVRHRSRGRASRTTATRPDAAPPHRSHGAPA